MFENMIEMIEKHERYGPAMQDAAGKQLKLILNYHTHGGPQGFCVQIAHKEENPLAFIGQSNDLQELVHIKGIGQTESQCQMLMGAFAQELKVHYKLEHEPVIYLNSKPFEAPPHP